MVVTMASAPCNIRFAIVGAGSVCEVKSGPAFYKAPGSSLVAVMVRCCILYMVIRIIGGFRMVVLYDKSHLALDPCTNPKRRTRSLAEDFARRHGVPRFYDDLDAMLHDSEVDAVYIATPPDTHMDLALRVCAAGKPCYLEKPMARSHSECVTILKAFKVAELPLYVGYYRRYLPKFRYAKAMLDDGRIGHITGVNMRLSQFRHKLVGEEPRTDWRVNAEHAGGGLFMDLGSHQLDLLDYLLGPLTEVYGSAQRLQPTDSLPTPAYAVEDRVVMMFKAPGGVLGTASWNFCSGVWEDQVEISGTLGSLSFSCFDNHPVRLEISAVDGAGGGRLQGPDIEEHQAEQPDHVHQPLVEAMVRDLQAWSLAKAKGEGAAWVEGGTRVSDPEESTPPSKECYSTGESAARTAFVMDRVLEGFYGGPGSREGSFWEATKQWEPPVARSSSLSKKGEGGEEGEGSQHSPK
ncbi:unnamed protein product [Discosporangium mesarthrocarpum]